MDVYIKSPILTCTTGCWDFGFWVLGSGFWVCLSVYPFDLSLYLSMYLTVWIHEDEMGWDGIDDGLLPVYKINPLLWVSPRPGYQCEWVELRECIEKGNTSGDSSRIVLAVGFIRGGTVLDLFSGNQREERWSGEVGIYIFNRSDGDI